MRGIVTEEDSALEFPARAAADPLSMLVFSHDLHDARFHKRLQIFSDLGFSVRWLAFDRERETNLASDLLQRLPGCVLGRTHDGRYVKRAVAMAQAIPKLILRKDLLGKTDIVYCINLDNLLMAILAKTIRRLNCRIAYEVADIQPILLRSDRIGATLRAIERWCLKRTDLVVYTSEHFMSQFLKKEQNCQVSSVLLENKIYPSTNLARKSPARRRSADKQLVIGLFGQLRCRKTMEIIHNLALAFPEKLQFVLRGYPNHEVREEFGRILANTPNLSYRGPYRYPDDLAEIYASVDLCWGFDFCSPGQNSKWCLTNRLYEAGYFGVPILVEADTAGGEFVRRTGSGWTVDPPVEKSLRTLFSRIEVAEVREKQAHITGLDASGFALDTDLVKLRRLFLELAS
jgi:succinoglycan biosynthesis protein ExoL